MGREECVMIKLKIQSEAKDSAVEIIKSAIASEAKRLEIGLQKMAFFCLPTCSLESVVKSLSWRKKRTILLSLTVKT